MLINCRTLYCRTHFMKSEAVKNPELQILTPTLHKFDIGHGNKPWQNWHKTLANPQRLQCCTVAPPGARGRRAAPTPVAEQKLLDDSCPASRNSNPIALSFHKLLPAATRRAISAFHGPLSFPDQLSYPVLAIPISMAHGDA